MDNNTEKDEKPNFDEQVNNVSINELEKLKDDDVCDVSIDKARDDGKSLEEKQTIEKNKHKEKQTIEEDHRKQLSASYDVTEEYIKIRENQYREIHQNIKDIKIDEVSQEDVKEIAKKAKANTIESTINEIAEKMSKSIVNSIIDDDTLTFIKPDSLYIQKEQRDFYINITKKLYQWKYLINQNPKMIVGDLFIKKLFHDFNFKVYDPQINILEENFSGKNGYINFLRTVSELVTEEQKEAIDDLIHFIATNEINVVIESFFKL